MDFRASDPLKIGALLVSLKNAPLAVGHVFPQPGRPAFLQRGVAQLQKELSLTLPQQGLIRSIFFCTLACVVRVAGYLSDFFSRRKIIGASLLFRRLSTSCMGLARDWIHLVFFRSVVSGGGEAF